MIVVGSIRCLTKSVAKRCLGLDRFSSSAAQYPTEIDSLFQSEASQKRDKFITRLPTSWEDIVKEAENIVKKEPFMEGLISSAILSRDNFSDALVHILAGHFGVGCEIDRKNWVKLMKSVHDSGDEYHRGLGTVPDLCVLDLNAVRDRDPACEGLLVHPILNFKGYKALHAHRVAHVLWRKGQKDAARAVQARCSAVFNVDIHPAATIGPGLMLDHATGLVVGETTVVGSNCSFLHGVTLGATGKQKGDRHPKIGNDVLIGCNVTVLGNITIGDSVTIGSGSIVLKPLPSHATAVGNPARIVGASSLISPAKEMDLALKFTDTETGVPFSDTWSTFLDGSCVFTEVDVFRRGALTREETRKALCMRFGALPPEDLLVHMFADADKNADGFVNKEEFEALSSRLGYLMRLATDERVDLRDFEKLAKRLHEMRKAKKAPPVVRSHNTTKTETSRLRLPVPSECANL